MTTSAELCCSDAPHPEVEHDLCCGACSDRLIMVERQVDKIAEILTIAYEKLDTMTKSPMIAAMFGMVNKK